jgi:Family of unknown function (DUF5763)
MVERRVTEYVFRSPTVPGARIRHTDKATLSRLIIRFERGIKVGLPLPSLDMWSPLWVKYITAEEVDAKKAHSGAVTVRGTDKCLGTRTDGKECNMTAGPSGYCTWHADQASK